MKILRYTFSSVSLIFLVIFAGCGNQDKNQQKSGAKPELTRLEVSIGGMTCTGCEQIIQTNVKKLDGIASIKADFKEGKAIVDFDPTLSDTAKIRSAITGSGYKVTGLKKAEVTEGEMK